MPLTIEEFQPEVRDALRHYEQFIVCVRKTPDQFLESVHSLLGKAIHTYENRAPGLRHGIALDQHVTIILSQTDGPRPFCGIYFNLHSPYRKPAAAQSR